ncbi:SH3 domain-containing protein, partial [Patescibacteria group bacterium]|nr:SH3 domain-containing protein [Patescibacteria group bacterium]
IQTAAEFNAAGYKWADVVETTPAIVAGYPDAAIAVVTVKVVNTSTLRVRASNTTASAISGKVSLNETFTVLEEKSGWYKIKTKTGITGWISGAYAVKQ